MQISLVDVDSKIPNLALMKLSTFHKAQGDQVSLIQCNMPYQAHRKKERSVDLSGAEKAYVASIFPGSPEHLHIINKPAIIEYGGTGYDICKTLPEEVEFLKPDYSLYPGTTTSYGFITRGCIRKCSFCFVPQKEGSPIRQVATVDEIVQHKEVEFLDNNFLAFDKHKEILQELIDKRIKFQFKQGLDIRLIDEENSLLLSKCRHKADIIFAFDNIKYKKLVERGLKFLSWTRPWQLKFFVYVHPDMSISDTMERVYFLRERNIHPYIMRDNSCWYSENRNFYIDIAAWCNQPHIFKSMDFLTMLKRMYPKHNRWEISYNLSQEK